MLLVNNPGDMKHVFAPLRHSTWHGCTPADVVFPFFLFVVGITTHLSMSRRAEDSSVFRAVIRRASLLFALGLLVNGFPFYENHDVAGPEWLPTFFGHVAARVAHLRVMGVLQRIGIAYLFAALLSWKASTQRIALTVAILLLGYWAVMTLMPVPGTGVIGAQLLDDPARNLSAWVDRATLDWTRWGLGWHLWDANIPYDPEGLLSTIPAIATVLLGVIAGRWLQSSHSVRDKLLRLAGAGIVAVAIALPWSTVFPINKSIWSSSYVLFTAGLACLVLAIVGWLVDVKQWTRWSRPFVIFGTNPILAYVGSELLASVLRSTIKWKLDGHRVGTEMAAVRVFEAAGIEAHVASLLWAVLYVTIWFAILRPLHRRGIFLKV